MQRGIEFKPVKDPRTKAPHQTSFALSHNASKKAYHNGRTHLPWYEHDAEEAARFYAETFPQSSVGAVHRAPADYPDGKAGDALIVEFTVAGIPCIGLNGGPHYKHSEAFSFQIATDDQEETDRYWNAIVGNGGQESQCGWCKDKWGLSWQITPRALTAAITDPDRAATSSQWVLLSNNRRFLTDEVVRSAAGELGRYANVPLWTDQYSNLLQLLK